MKRILTFTFFSFLALTLISGRPPKLPKPKKGEWIEPAKIKNIFGNWIWIETDCCGIRHGISTPKSTGDNIELEIMNDNTFLEVHTKINALPRSGSINTYKEEEADMIQFNDERPARYFLSANSDTLTISWKYLELQTEKYIRK
jgi:hypothetical protein